MISTINHEKLLLDISKKVIVFLGASGSGKNELLLHIVKEVRVNPKNILIISPTWHEQKEKMQKAFKGALVVTQDFQNSNFSKVRNKTIILDDISNELYNNKSLNTAIISKRHFNNTFIILTQSLKFIPTQVRLNCEYKIVFGVYQLNEIKKIYEHWLMNIKHFDNINKFITYIKSFDQHDFIILAHNSIVKCRLKIN